jgi:hypothetical protein
VDSYFVVGGGRIAVVLETGKGDQERDERRDARAMMTL